MKNKGARHAGLVGPDVEFLAGASEPTSELPGATGQGTKGGTCTGPGGPLPGQCFQTIRSRAGWNHRYPSGVPVRVRHVFQLWLAEDFNRKETPRRSE